MEYDSATGQYYDRARDYSSTTGRFMSQDPKGFAAGDPDLYRYVGNGPTNAVDPTGNDKNDALKAHSNGNKHTIDLPITIYGPGSSAGLANQIRQDIQKYWNGKTSNGQHEVIINPIVKVGQRRGDGPNPVYVFKGHSGMPAQTGVYCPVCPTAVPGKTSSRAFWNEEDSPWTHAHESGHFLGFHDQYDPKTMAPRSGFANTIMGQRDGTADTAIRSGPYANQTYRDITYNRFVGSSAGMSQNPADHP
jgi:RHS repeat-associated protein